MVDASTAAMRRHQVAASTVTARAAGTSAGRSATSSTRRYAARLRERPAIARAAYAVTVGASRRHGPRDGRHGRTSSGAARPQGDRQLPGLRRADPGAGRALARPDQGRRRARERRARACSTPRRRSASPPPATGSRTASSTTSSRSTSSRPARARRSNMNANEVIATLAGEDVHANDDVNMGQSSNDVFPSAVHLAALDELANDLLPGARPARGLARARRRSSSTTSSSRAARTGWTPSPSRSARSSAATPRRCARASPASRSTLERLGQDPARRHRGRHRPEHASRVRRARPRALLAPTPASRSPPPADPFEAQAARDGLVEASGALKTVAVSLTKIANDLRFMGSGPRAGLAEIFLPELQKGSSIMPGKVNPVIPEVVTQVAAQVIGNDAAITVGGMQGHFELNVFVPLMARNLLAVDQAARVAPRRLLAEKCVDGIEANREQCERYAELTLSAATALNPYIGYDKATEIVKEAAASRPLAARGRARGRRRGRRPRRGARLPRDGQAPRSAGVNGAPTVKTRAHAPRSPRRGRRTRRRRSRARQERAEDQVGRDRARQVLGVGIHAGEAVRVVFVAPGIHKTRRVTATSAGRIIERLRRRLRRHLRLLGG